MSRIFASAQNPISTPTPQLVKLRTLLPLLGLITVGTARAEFRTYTSNEGVTLRAEILKLEGSSVTLRREDGQTFTLPLTRFSNADQFTIQTEFGSKTVSAPGTETKEKPAAEKSLPRSFRIKKPENLGGDWEPQRPALKIALYHGIEFDEEDLKELFGEKSSTESAAQMLVNFGLNIKVFPFNWSSDEEALDYIKTHLVTNGPFLLRFKEQDEFKGMTKRQTMVIGYNDFKKSIEVLLLGKTYQVKYENISQKTQTVYAVSLAKDEISDEVTKLSVRTLLERSEIATSYDELERALKKSEAFKFTSTECNSHENTTNAKATRKTAQNGPRLIRTALRSAALVIIPQSKDCLAVAFYREPSTNIIQSLKLANGTWTKSDLTIGRAAENWVIKRNDKFSLPSIRLTSEPR